MVGEDCKHDNITLDELRYDFSNDESYLSCPKKCNFDGLYVDELIGMGKKLVKVSDDGN